MNASPEFTGQTKEFWANVKLISEAVGYTERKSETNPDPTVKVPGMREIALAYVEKGLSTEPLCDTKFEATLFGKKLLEYFKYRAEILNNVVRGNLMDKEEAGALFHKIRSRVNPPSELLPMNVSVFTTRYQYSKGAGIPSCR